MGEGLGERGGGGERPNENSYCVLPYRKCQGLRYPDYISTLFEMVTIQCY